MRRAHPLSALRDFLHNEAAGGILLMIAAAGAMVVANSGAAEAYEHFLHAPIGPLSIHLWINDALMALFFLLVGLEIKRELLDGHLSSWADRALPSIAAVAGMAVPAFLYLGIAGSTPGLSRGWAIPSATDIAFAIGVMALLGSRAPASLKLFLTSVAIVDDMGAVVIIAVAYTTSLNFLALAAAAAVLLAMYGMNRRSVTRLNAYLALGGLLWVAIFLSGVHATLAGVLTAMFVPLRAPPPHAEDDERSALLRLERLLHPWVAFAIVPLFGFANAGVSLAGVGPDALVAPLPLAIAAGLFLGKQLGVFGAVWAATRIGLAPRPGGASWPQIYGTALLCGIGFTMSLFIGGLAFPTPDNMEAVKLGVLSGSLLSAAAGFLVLRLSAPSDGRHAGP